MPEKMKSPLRNSDDLEFSAASAYISKLLDSDNEKSPALASIETLYQCLKTTKATTLLGLREELLGWVESMRNTDYSSASIASASDLFIRFISLASLEHEDFDQCKKVLLDRGAMFLKRVGEARTKIADLSTPFIRDGSRILTHSLSRVVLKCLVKAAGEGRDFQVFVTQSLPDNSGLRLKQEMERAGIKCTLILDGAVGYIMESIDMVLLGAEGVMETGGIVNKIGSYSIAICAKATNKPVYVMAESIKFVKEYPLSQTDIPQSFKYKTSTIKAGNLDTEHPLVDYTPPAYIKLLFTDLGILTPAAVSDELIKLYL